MTINRTTAASLERSLDIDNIMGALQRIQGSFVGWAQTEKVSFKVNPDKFNRLPFTVGDRRYVVSVFVPEESEAEDSELPELPLEFAQDHRQNPKLHRLYVSMALKELDVVNSFIEEMEDFSTFTSSIIVSSVIEETQKQIMSDAAWFEAAGLIQAKVDLTPYINYDQDEHELEERSRLPQ